MNELKIFQNPDFGQVRAIEKDGEPWLVGKDVAVILGYAKPENAVANHVDNEDKTTTLIQGNGSNYKSKTTIINESGLYSLVFSSKLKTAKQFKRWVTSEVLPSIRKTGGYIAGQETLSDDELFEKALLVAQRRIEERDKQIERMKPKEIFADAVSTSKTSILIGELAKLLKQNGIEIGQKRLFDWLRSNGYLIRGNRTDKNMPTQRSMELGLFEIKETTISHSDGHITVNKTPKVTGKGQVYFINKFLRGAQHEN